MKKKDNITFPIDDVYEKNVKRNYYLAFPAALIMFIGGSAVVAFEQIPAWLLLIPYVLYGFTILPSRENYQKRLLFLGVKTKKEVKEHKDFSKEKKKAFMIETDLELQCAISFFVFLVAFLVFQRNSDSFRTLAGIGDLWFLMPCFQKITAYDRYTAHKYAVKREKNHPDLIDQGENMEENRTAI